MNGCFITFRSVTPAQRGERILRRAGLHCTLQRTPRWMEEQGCGYSLRMPEKSAHSAIQLLKNAGIPYRKAYLMDENGGLAEWKI